MNQSVSIQSSRQIGPDVVKGIAILGVVVIHLLDIFDINEEKRSTIKSIFRFAVPCFIIFFGYFIQRSLKKKTCSLLVKERMHSILIIFLFWTTLYILIGGISRGYDLQSFVTKYLIGFGWSGQYYLLVMIQILILLPFLRTMPKHPYLSLAVHLSTLFTFIALSYGKVDIGLLKKLGIVPCVYWISYFVIGLQMHQIRCSVSFGIVALATIIPLIEHLLLLSLNPSADPYLRPGVFMAALIITFWALNTKETNSLRKISKLLRPFSTKTMIIFLANPLIIYLVSKVDFLRNSEKFGIPGSISFLLCFVIILFGCFLVDGILRKTKLSVLSA